MSSAVYRSAKKWFQRSRGRKSIWSRPRLVNLEGRVTPASATFSAGTLTINYTFTGTTPEEVVISNDGTDITLSGDVTGVTSKLMSAVNKLVVTASGASTNQSFVFDSFSDDPYSFSNGFTSTGVDSIWFDMAVSATGTGVISVTAPKSIIINDTVASANGAITLKANTQVTPSTGGFIGIEVYADIKSTAGTITLEGRGGDDSAGSQHGVLVDTGAIVGGTSTGAVSVTGTGGAGTGQFNIGVYVFDGVVSASGSVTVNGTGGAVPGNDNYGVYVADTGAITSSSGGVSVTGNGGGSGASSNNHGVEADGPISATGTGTVTIHGTAGTTTGVNNNGVFVSGGISTANGSISITGLGGGSGGATGSNFGVFLNPTTISAGGAGTLTIHGTAGATPGVAEHGVYVESTTITTNTGTLTITGIQGNAASEGVRVDGGASITSAGSADLTINSTGMLNLSNGTLTTGKNMNLNSTGPITQFPAGNLFANSGTLTVSASGQVATFQATGNTAAQLVIPANVTAFVNGSFDASGSVQVSGKLGGIGSVGTVTVIGTGEIAPGQSPGKLTTGNIAFNSGTSLNVEINGANAIIEYDQLTVLGTVTLGGATLKGTIGFYVPTVGQKFTIINNDGTGDAVTGTFNGVVEGGTVSLGSYTFAVSYKGGDGNDVVLTRTAPTGPTATFTFGDGTSQRSIVKQIAVTFSEAVNFFGAVADAFTLFRSGSSTPTANVALTTNPINGPASSVTITFSGSLTTNGSLNDGFYNFTIDADQVTGVGGKLNSGTDYTVTGTTTNGYFRLFGDGDGNGVTNLTDFAAFRSVFNLGTNSAYDYGEGDNNVGLADFAQFRSRFNLTP